MKNKRKNKFNIRKQYADAWAYVKECKIFIWGIVALFFISSFIGFVVPASSGVEEKILDFIKEILQKTGGMSSLELIWFILLNNTQSSFFGLIFGVFLGIFPVLVAVLNGYLLGFVAQRSVEVAGVFSLWRILPHGIIELTAVFISLGMGVKFGTFIFLKDKVKSFRKFLFESLNVFVFVVFPLLIIAGIIEGLLISYVG